MADSIVSISGLDSGLDLFFGKGASRGSVSVSVSVGVHDFRLDGVPEVSFSVSVSSYYVIMYRSRLAQLALMEAIQLGTSS